jgi:hypothetical protein
LGNWGNWHTTGHFQKPSLLMLSHKSFGGYPDSYRDQKKFFQSGKKSKNRKRFFDFLPLYKILFAPDSYRDRRRFDL